MRNFLLFGVYYFVVIFIVIADGVAAIESNSVSSEVFSHGSGGRVGCGATVRSYGAGGARSGHFDTRATTWRSQCAIHLLGTPTDVVQVSLFNYNLR